MIENKHLRIGRDFSSLLQSFIPHIIDEASDLIIFLYSAGKFPTVLMGLEIAQYDMRFAHPDLTALVLTILVLFSSYKEATELSDDIAGHHLKSGWTVWTMDEGLIW